MTILRVAVGGAALLVGLGAGAVSAVAWHLFDRVVPR